MKVQPEDPNHRPDGLQGRREKVFGEIRLFFAYLGSDSAPGPAGCQEGFSRDQQLCPLPGISLRIHSVNLAKRRRSPMKRMFRATRVARALAVFAAPQHTPPAGPPASTPAGGAGNP